MITGELKGRVDRLWEEFWTGGITNPLTVIEQITFLMFSRLLDMAEATNERKAARSGKLFARLFPADQYSQWLRWSHFKNLPAEAMLAHVRDRVFPHFKTVAAEGAAFQEYMKDAQLLIQRPSLLVSAVQMIDSLPLAAADVKGDLYEYLLSKLTTAGINGQFRTPRHVIRLMVEILDPQPTERIADPACGTAGFLVAVMEYLQEKHTSPAGVIVDEITGQRTYSGDLLEPHRAHIRNAMFHGFDFDVTMLRVAAMNLLLHGVDAPNIHYQDSLSGTFAERFPRLASRAFDVVLANPPFKGSLDEENVAKELRATVKTKKTELLFVALILRMLKEGGRSATIVPDGVLFGSSTAHKALRKTLLENNQLEAVVSLPPGAFKPYAGVSTAILVFTRGGSTRHVFFYDVATDGYSLDDKRQQVAENDLPDCLRRWRGRDVESDTDRTAKAFFVPVEEIAAQDYDLSLNRYRRLVHEDRQHDPPRTILARMRALEEKIQQGMEELEGMLR